MRSTQSKAGQFDPSINRNRGAGLAGPIGGAPGRRESQYGSPADILNSSSITDKNKFRVIGGGGPPVIMANSSVISRASAL